MRWFEEDDPRREEVLAEAGEMPGQSFCHCTEMLCTGFLHTEFIVHGVLVREVLVHEPIKKWKKPHLTVVGHARNPTKARWGSFNFFFKSPTKNIVFASPRLLILVDTTILASIFLSTGTDRFFMVKITRFFVRFSVKSRTCYWQT